MQKIHHKWLVPALAVTSLLVLGGCSKKAATTAAPVTKTVSFVKQAKGAGTHIWLRTSGSSSDNLSLTKDSLISKICVLQGGKITAYQIFDSDASLGNLSKLSDADTIKYAKKQDKKYFAASAQEVQQYIKNQNQIGQYNDVAGDEDVTDFFDGDKDYDQITFTSITRDHGDNQTSSDHFKIVPATTTSPQRSVFDEYNTVNVGTVSLQELLNSEKLTDDRDNHAQYNYGKRISKAVISNIKKVSYHAPKSQKLTDYTETSDDSGNKITSQAVAYKSIDYFNVKNTGKTFYKAFKDNPKITQLISDHYNSTNSLTLSRSSKVFTDKMLQTATKGVFGYYPWKSTVNMTGIVKQPIYQTRYIGYNLVDIYSHEASGYLITRGQTKSQTAVFAK